MTQVVNILDAVQARLKAAFPDREHVEDLTRTNFPRPSFYCRFDPPEVRDAGRWSLHIKQAVEVVCFEVLQNRSSLQCDLRLLLDTQQRVMELFSTGFLPVGDRALHLTAQAGELDSDAATVLLQLDYYDDRPPAGRVYDAMGDLQIAVNEEV